MSAKSDPRPGPEPTSYSFRRSLSARELLPALGAGLAVGAVVFYLTAIVLERTPLDAGGRGAPGRPPRRRARGG